MAKIRKVNINKDIYLCVGLSFYKNISIILICVSVFFEIHGCAMNVNDTEVIWSVLKNHGYQLTNDIKNADIVLLVTCAIRDGAEQKIWNKLFHLSHMKQKRKGKIPLKIGLLGKINVLRVTMIFSRRFIICSCDRMYGRTFKT